MASSHPSYWNLSNQLDLQLGGHFKPQDCLSRDRVAIIVPYRNRDVQLRDFLGHMHKFLRKQSIDYAIFVVEQITNQTFNRAKLMNVGAVEALKLYNWDCFIFHDVDLIPENEQNLYNCPEQPRHMSVAVSTMNYRFRLRHNNAFGGVTALTVGQLNTTNGYSNEYWGWGGEDDDMAQRVRINNFQILRRDPKVARYRMAIHQRDYQNDINKCRWKFQKALARIRWKKDGLNSLQYNLVNSVFVANLFTRFTVDLLESQSRARMKAEGQCK